MSGDCVRMASSLVPVNGLEWLERNDQNQLRRGGREGVPVDHRAHAHALKVDLIALWWLIAMCMGFLLIIPSNCELCDDNNTICKMFCQMPYEPKMPMIIALIVVAMAQSSSHVPISVANMQIFVSSMLFASIVLLWITPVTTHDRFNIHWRKTNGCNETILKSWNPKIGDYEETIKEGPSGWCPAMHVEIYDTFCPGSVITSLDGRKTIDPLSWCRPALYASHARNSSQHILTVFDTQFNMLPYIEQLAENCTASKCSEALTNIKITRSWTQIALMMAMQVCTIAICLCIQFNKNPFKKECLLKLLMCYFICTTYNMWHSEEFDMETVLRACHSIVNSVNHYINMFVVFFEKEGGGWVVVMIGYVFCNMSVIVLIPYLFSLLPEAAANDIAYMIAHTVEQAQKAEKAKWKLPFDWTTAPLFVVGFVIWFRYHRKQHVRAYIIAILAWSVSYFKVQTLKILNTLWPLCHIWHLVFGDTQLVAEMTGGCFVVISLLDALLDPLLDGLRTAAVAYVRLNCAREASEDERRTPAVITLASDAGVKAEASDRHRRPDFMEPLPRITAAAYQSQLKLK